MLGKHRYPEMWVQILAPPITFGVILRKLLIFLSYGSPIYKIDTNNNTNFIGLFWEMQNKLIDGESLIQCVTYTTQ